MIENGRRGQIISGAAQCTGYLPSLFREGSLSSRVNFNLNRRPRAVHHYVKIQSLFGDDVFRGSVCYKSDFPTELLELDQN